MKFERQYTEPEISFQEWVITQGVDPATLARDSDYAEVIGGALSASTKAAQGKLKRPLESLESTKQLKIAYQKQVESGAIRTITKSQPLDWESKADQAYARMQIKRAQTPEIKNAWQAFYDNHFQITDTQPMYDGKISNTMTGKIARPFYDIEQLKSIPIHEVAQAFGVQVKKAGNDYWCAIRDERTPSCKLYTKTNSFCDFGAANYGGDTIELTKFLHSCSSRYEAMDILAQTFGIQPEQQNGNFRKLPSVRQFAKIGIYGDVATKNFDFHIEKYGVEGARKISEKYRMTVEKLSELYPDVYHQMLRAKAVPYVHALRNAYLSNLRFCYDTTVNFGWDAPIDDSLFDEAREMLRDAETAERILKQAIQNPQKVNFQQNTYDLQADYTAIANGEMSVELTASEPMEYYELRAFSKASGRPLQYSGLDYDLYHTLSDSLQEITPYSAFVKGDTVKLAYDAEFAEQINDLINFREGEQLAEIAETATMQMFPGV